MRIKTDIGTTNEQDDFQLERGRDLMCLWQNGQKDLENTQT